jgi:cytochrome b6-f complex iron-sulfur subunit
MNNLKDTCENNSEAICNNRRDFLVKASVTAGGLLLSLSGAATSANAKTADKTEMTGDDSVILKLDDKSPLSKIGGSDTVETKSGKVVVVRTGEMAFSAYSAVCTHKGGPIKYDADKKQLFCPWHNSRFDTNGKKVSGPANQDLATYAAQESVVVTLTPKA